ncbi:MAG TPA: undecaprenyldiphospho-muramoylpentapeptide beta-N-acetylglucosaminyltransferase [Terriglobales bacterium]|nr:undecaprenyldiphospho-muramoylpentapeptide beta-N-acetylglucosaminyltransferase [Terriglobales bacterium]
MSASTHNVVIAGGGTGGHLIPGLAVARALVERGIDAGNITFVGTARGIEARMVPASGFALRLIAIAGWKGTGLARRLRAAAQLPIAIGQCVRILRQTRAHVVFGIGGYASGPALAAALVLRIPVVLLEVNASAGLANRLAARWARAAAVNFPETARQFKHALVTGIPVRAEFFPRSGEGALENDEPANASVLVFGGSQGARAINAAAGELAERLPPGTALRRQTGADDFIADMAGAMRAAQVVVARAGASTLGELAAAGKPSVLIPLPTAADQHQLRNAEAYARAGAAVLLPQAELTPERLAKEVNALLGDRAQRQRMAAAVRNFAHRDAAAAIAGLILENKKGTD